MHWLFDKPEASDGPGQSGRLPLTTMPILRLLHLACLLPAQHPAWLARQGAGSPDKAAGSHRPSHGDIAPVAGSELLAIRPYALLVRGMLRDTA